MSHPCLIIVVLCTKLIELVKTLCGFVEILKLKFGRDFEVMFGEVTTALIKIFIEIKHSMSVFGCFFTCRLPLDNVEAGISCNIMSVLVMTKWVL